MADQMDEKQAEHVRGILERTFPLADDATAEQRAVQDAMIFCAGRVGWGVGFVASSGAPYVRSSAGTIGWRSDLDAWEFWRPGQRPQQHFDITDALAAFESEGPSRYDGAVR